MVGNVMKHTTLLTVDEITT